MTGKVGLANQMRRVFLSYSRDDELYAMALHDDLEKRGLGVFLDKDIDPGAGWRGTLANEIESADFFVLVFSQRSDDSPEVAKEVSVADALGKTIIPVRIDQSLPSGALLYELADRNWIEGRTNGGLDKRVGEKIAHYIVSASSEAEGSIPSNTAGASMPHPASKTRRPRSHALAALGIYLLAIALLEAFSRALTFDARYNLSLFIMGGHLCLTFLFLASSAVYFALLRVRPADILRAYLGVALVSSVHLALHLREVWKSTSYEVSTNVSVWESLIAIGGLFIAYSLLFGTVFVFTWGHSTSSIKREIRRRLALSQG